MKFIVNYIVNYDIDVIDASQKNCDISETQPVRNTTELSTFFGNLG